MNEPAPAPPRIWTGRVICMECMHAWIASVQLAAGQSEPANVCCPECGWPKATPIEPANDERRP